MSKEIHVSYSSGIMNLLMKAFYYVFLITYESILPSYIILTLFWKRSALCSVNAGLCTAGLSSQIYFTDETRFQMAWKIVPGVRMTPAEIHAGFVLVEIIRLSGMPVDVGHRGQWLAAGIRGHHSPDERGLASRIRPLSSRPEVDSLYVVSVAPAQCCLWTECRIRCIYKAKR